MGCNVLANDDEIACKAGANKVIAEFPDVCLSPPSPPAGPSLSHIRTRRSPRICRKEASRFWIGTRR